MPSAGIAFTSSIVSVGKPIIKYSFTLVHPPEKAVLQVFNSSSSFTFLLIASLNLCEPASGAKVKPLLRTVLIFDIISSVKPSTLNDGKEILTCSSTDHLFNSVSSGTICV